MRNPPPDLRLVALATTWGTIRLVAGEPGVWSCELPAHPDNGNRTAFRVLDIRFPARPESWLREAAGYAQALLEGRAEPAVRPPVHPAVFDSATPFRRAVWRVLQQIPGGQTLTYAGVAREAGHPDAARAVGGACGANPVPLFIPCHRVVAAHGRGGFSSGLSWKRHLLSAERLVGAESVSGSARPGSFGDGGLS